MEQPVVTGPHARDRMPLRAHDACDLAGGSSRSRQRTSWIPKFTCKLRCS